MLLTPTPTPPFSSPTALTVRQTSATRPTAQAQPPVGSRPGQIAFGSGSLWVANLDDQTISRIDVATRRVSRTLPVVDTPTGLATSPGAVWVLGSTPTAPSVTVRRIDPQFDVVARQTRIGNVVPGGPGFVAGSVWVANSRDGT